MKTFFISYLDNEGDLCHVHVEAFDKDDAKLQVRREYWNVDEIIQVTVKEIKEELIHKTYVTKYEANDGTIFTTSEECQKYENSARAALLAKYKELEIKMISEYNLFGVGSEEYYVSVVKLRNESDVDLMTQLYFLFNPRYENDSCRIEEARSIFRKAVKTGDFLIINRGCEYDHFDAFWIFGLLTDTLNSVVKACDPGSIIEIKDDLTYPDKQ